MKLEEEQALLAAAAAPILELIREDREGALPPLRPLFQYLEDHLFDLDFEVGRWLATGLLAADLTRKIFSRQIGIDPEAYLWDRRLHTGLRLLHDTSLSVTAIGEMVGFSGRQAFSDAFEEWLGERPTAYRRDAQQRAARYGRPPEWMLTEPFLQRLEAGRLTATEADAVRERLQHLLEVMEPREAPRDAPTIVRGADDDVTFEKLMASELWQKIEGLPFQEQKIFVANQATFETTALGDLLLEKSEEVEGQKGREREHLADLAQEALERTLRGQARWTFPD